MIAVVDAAAERRIVVGAAAAAGLACRLVQHDRDTRFGEAYSGGEAGEAGADDMNAARSCHSKPWRTASQILSALVSFTSRSRWVQPR
jgi:hypothetical protein